MKQHRAMRYAYRELATIGMVVLIVSNVVVVAGLVSLWDPMGMRKMLKGTQLVGFVSLLGVFDLLLAYSNTILVLYLARFRSKLQAVLIYLVAAVVLAVPCTVAFYGACSMFLGERATHTAFWTVLSVHVVGALWSAAVVAYVLVLRLERRRDRALRRTAPSGLRTSGEEHSRPRSGLVASSGGTDPAPETVSRTVETPAESRTAQDLPGSEAVSDVSSGGTPSEQEFGKRELGQEAATGRAENDGHVAGSVGSRILEALSGDVVCVRVSGHYIDVVTTTGSSVLLMRLGDAMAALGDRGMQTHRSYWVAYHHMRRLVRRDHRMAVRLSDGQEVPVSRPYIRPVRERINNSSAHATPDPGEPE